MLMSFYDVKTFLDRYDSDNYFSHSTFNAVKDLLRTFSDSTWNELLIELSGIISTFYHI